jgi:hypothetical protein
MRTIDAPPSTSQQEGNADHRQQSTLLMVGLLQFAVAIQRI